MKTPRKLSPARSQGPVRTPIQHKHRRTLSVSSARSQGSVRLSTLIKQNRNVKLISPLSRRSILTDNTEIEEPRRNSWWKKLGENSRDVIEFLEENKVVEPLNIIEELDMEILSQEQKNYNIDLPESSGSESIHSIVIPRRKLFPQKENLHQKKFGQIISTRETLGKLYKPNTSGVDPTINAGTRQLFPNKKSSKPIFPAALLNMSPNKTAADKTRELATVEPKAQVHTIFGNRATKRKNIFTNFIVSESEDDIPEIQAKVFRFQNKIDVRRRGSSSSRGIRERSPTSSITTDIEMDDWKMLPSSTMVENQLEIMIADGQSPKRTRLSKLKEIESDAPASADLSTKQSNKSASSKEEDKTRKSKTFIKEKAPAIETSITTKNKPEVAQYDDEEIFNNNRSMTTRNKSKVSQNDNELTLVENKSRKSKTFIKEKELDLEASMTKRNKSKTYFPTLAQNKSKIADENLSQSSIKTRSKKGSPNTSHVIEEPDFNNKPQISNKNKSKSIATSFKDTSKNKVSDKAPVADQGSDNDDELNFTLKYDDENNEEISENIQNKSERRASKCMSQKMSTTNVSKMNKVVDESAELESTQEKSNSMKIMNKSRAKVTSKVIEKDQIQENEELEADKHYATNDSDSNYDRNGMDVDENAESDDECKDVQDETIIQTIDEKESEVENNDNSMVQNGSEVNASQERDEENDKHDEQDEENNEDEMQEREESHEVQNLSRPENESQVLEDEIEDDNNESEEEHNESEVIEKEQNYSQEEQRNESVVEQNETQEIEQDNTIQEVEDESEDEDQNISKEELEDESNVEQNESGIEENEERNETGFEDNEEQNESGIEDNEEQNESEDENEEESEAVADSDNENDESNQSQEVANESDNQDTNEGESEQENDTLNVSHDTPGRNRKKNESLEVILRDNNRHLDYFDVQGRNSSLSKTEMIKTMHIKRSLAPLRESTGLSDGAKNSSAEGSGWDSHRTTRKTLRQTFGKDFTPRKSLRALVMEKSAKRQTQHNDIASITVKFPQANSTELPEMSNRFDDEVDEIQESNHEVSPRTRQTKQEFFLDQISKKNAETRLKIEEAVRESLKAPPRHVFKVPARPFFAQSSQTKPKPTAKKQGKSKLFFGELPEEVLEDFKYKPPKRFGPRDAAWITKRLYKFLETKLEPKYDYKARIRAEKLVENIYHFSKEVRRRREPANVGAVDALKHEMARLDIVKSHLDFYDFFHEFMPREVRIKVIPDIVNKIPLPSRGVFADIL